jgi:UDP-N-acetylglucosamine--N-acetylmuramyl-(pentapeptide) pyrophosphoryl-undecaprenol N-acetylglucosamine transferase
MEVVQGTLSGGQRTFLRVLMAAGGTGGHIFPALAVAEELRRRSEELRSTSDVQTEVEFVGTNRGLESRVIPKAGFALRTVRAAGLKGVGGRRKILNLLVLPQSVLETALVLRKFQPHVVVGVGGYLAGPAMLEASLQDIPTLLIEPNAFPGFTNRVLAPLVRIAAVGFEGAARFYGAKARWTGHPVRKPFYQLAAKPHFPPFTVLILGGSQGSKAINDCVMDTVELLSSNRAQVRVVHQTGERDYNAVQEVYKVRGLSAEIHPFIEDVPQALAGADLVVSRSGATTVAELAAAGKASLLVPFPGATDHHQLDNARALERAGAARVIEQPELTPARLAEEIAALLAQPNRLVEMEQRVRSLARPDATECIADLIEQLGRSRRLLGRHLPG